MGFPGYVRMYLSGDHENNIFADGSYDAGVIMHEYTHGVSGRLGRDVYDTYQGRAMGEAWSDFFAMEMTVPEGSRPEDRYVLGEYLFTGVWRGYSQPALFHRHGRKRPDLRGLRARHGYRS